MPAPTTTRLRAGLTLALMAFFFAGAAPAGATGQIQVSGSGMVYGISTVQVQACQAGSTGNWVEANGVTVEGAERRMSLTFSTPLATNTLHAAMNEAGARDLALVEFMDVDGVWRKAWEGQLDAPAPAFAQQTCYEHQLPQQQVVQALRFTFRAVPGRVEVNHAALLRR
jgi:hypothetical protein